MIQCVVCVASSNVDHNTENTTSTSSLVIASVIPKMPVRLILEYLETPVLGDSVRIRHKDFDFLLNPGVLYFSGQDRWGPVNINPLHDNTNAYLIYTSLQSVKLFGHEHAYTSPYISMTVPVQELSRLCIQLLEKSTEHSTCICSKGYTNDTSGECVPCAAGTYKVSTGNQTCTDCPENSTSSAGFPACGVCDIGFYSNMSNSNMHCSQCPGGKTSAVNSMSAADCACPRGFKEESANVCTPCPAGTYEFDGVCTPCGVQSDAPQGSTQCLCNEGSIRGPDGLCVCDKEYSLASGNTGTTQVCQPCIYNAWKPLIGNTPCYMCGANQLSTADTLQCHCRPGFGTHAEPAEVTALSANCWGQYTLLPAMSGSVYEDRNLFEENDWCFYDVRTPSDSTTIQLNSLVTSPHKQNIYRCDVTTNGFDLAYTINPWVEFTGGQFHQGCVRIKKTIVVDKAMFPYGEWEEFGFTWEVLPKYPCNLCNANMYEDNTGLYSQCHPCPGQKSSPPGSTSPNQCL